MKKTTTSISDNIRSLREKKGLSQEKMSDLLKVSQQTYSLIEKNPEKQNLSRVQEIAKILDVKISFLLNEDESFVLNTFNQQGGNAISNVHSITNEETHKQLVKQMESEITFLRGVIASNSFSVPS